MASAAACRCWPARCAGRLWRSGRSRCAASRPAPVLLGLPCRRRGGRCPPLHGRKSAADIVDGHARVPRGARPATVMGRIAKGFTDEEIRGHRGLARRSLSEGHGRPRRPPPFLKLAAGAPPGACPVAAVGAGDARASWCRRRLRRRHLRARMLKRRPGLDVTLVEPNPTFIACPFSNAVLAGLREISQQQFGYEASRPAASRVAATTRDRGRCRRQGTVTLARRHEARLRPAGAGARHRHAVGRAARLRRGGGRERCRMPGRPARRPLLLRSQLQAMEDGGTGGDVGAGQSVPLPARALRARQPDRALAEDPQAALQAV